MTDYIRRMLDLSTAHLPEEYGSGYGLDNPLGAADGVVAHRTEFGFLMWVPNDPVESDEAMDPRVPPEILAIQVYARKLDCDYVLFDADGTENENLPTFTWENT